MTGRNDVGQISTHPSGMVRLLVPGTYDPDTKSGDGKFAEGPCRSIVGDADGTITFYDYTNTLVTGYPLIKGIPAPVGAIALTAATMNAFGLF